MSRDPRSFWDAPFFRPRIGGRRGGASSGRVPTLKRTVLQRLALMGVRSGSKSASTARRRAPRDVRQAPPFSRRCVVKARYVQMDARGAKAAKLHLAYIERDGVERDGSKGRLFDARGDVERDAFAAPIDDEQRQFRFIVSPEDGDELDLRDYTRRLMKRVEKDLGQGLRWAAVCHYNTDNPHVHLVLRGVDDRGHDVWIDRAYISDFMRLRAQELATLELGPRSEIEVQQQLSREISQERLTGIDRRLGELAAPDGSLDMAEIASAQRLSRVHALARLQTLEDLSLVERTSPASWHFADGWQDVLQDLGERGDIIKRMHQIVRGHPGSYRVFDVTAPGAAVEGVVRHKGLHDELRGDMFAIVDTPRGEAHYLRLDRVTAEQLKEGEHVRIRCERDSWVKQPDHAIERFAAGNDGVYDPAKHRHELRWSPAVFEGGRFVSEDATVNANVNRLQRLERFNLVTKLPDGTWRVPADLTRQLGDRERTHPRHRLQVEQLELQRHRERDRDFDLGL